MSDAKCDCEEILLRRGLVCAADALRNELDRRAEAALLAEASDHSVVEPTPLERALCRCLMRLSIQVGGVAMGVPRGNAGYDRSDWGQIMKAAGSLGGDDE